MSTANDVALVIDGAELREVGGEGTTVLEKAPARLVVHGGGAPTLEVGGTKAKFTKYTKMGDREYKFATDDVMTFLYLELPKGLPEAQYAAVAAVFEALAEGKPVPAGAVDGGNAAAPAAAAPAAAASGAAAAAAPATATATAAAPAAGIGALFGALAAKAIHDTKAVGAAIREKAEHDLKLMQEQQAAANAAALKREEEEKAAKAAAAAGAGAGAPAPA